MTHAFFWGGFNHGPSGLPWTPWAPWAPWDPKEPFVSFCNGRLLSPTGRCKTFDAAADGAWAPSGNKNRIAGGRWFGTMEF